jgi:hypothetical protein
LLSKPPTTLPHADASLPAQTQLYCLSLHRN